MTKCIVETLKHICRVSTSSIVRNADGLLSRHEEEMPVHWIGESKTRVPSQKFKISYYFFLVNIIEKLPVEIRFRTVTFMRLIDVFHFSCASKLTFEICSQNKRFKDKKRISKHIVSFDPEMFNFFKEELEALSDTIGKMLKDTIKKIALYSTLPS